MAGQAQPITLEVGLEIKAALARLEKFEKETAKSTGKIEKAFDQLKGVAGAALAVFAGKQVIDFFAAGVEAAAAQQAAMTKLGAALEATGEHSQAALDHFKDFADEMEKSTKYGDDFVLTQVAMAKSFGISNAQAEELVRTAADLAAATGDTLDGAVEKLGKTYSGATGKLDDMVPALRGLTKEQLANGAAVRLLADRYKGAAGAELNTFSGALLRVQNAVGNLQEAFGDLIVSNPVVIATLNGIAEAFGVLEGSVADNQDGLRGLINFGIKAFVATVDGALGAVETIALGFVTFTRVVAESQESLLSVARVVGIFNPSMGAAAAALTGLASASAEKVKGFAQEFTKLRASVGLSAQKIFEADEKVTESAKKSQDARRKAAKAVVEDAKGLEKLADAAAKFETALRQNTGDEESNLKAKLKEQLAEIDEFERQKVYSAKHAEELRVIAVGAAFDKITELHKSQAEKAAAIAKEAADKQAAADKEAAEKFKKYWDERRAAVERYANSPATLAVDTFKGPDFKSLEQRGTITSDTANGIAAGTGLLGKVLDGSDGAKSLITEGAGAFADAFIPGIGGAVSGVLGKLAEGPEATKAFIKDFIASVPEIVTAIAESIPVVVEALVESLIVDGGLFKIAAALGKGLLGIIPGVGKALAKSFSDNSNKSAKLGKALTQGLSLGGVITAGNIKEAFKVSVGAFKLFMKGDFQGAFNKAFDFAKSLLPKSMQGAANKIQASVNRAFVEASRLTFQSIAAGFRQASRKLLIELPIAIFRGLFVTLPGVIRSGFQTAVSFMSTTLPNILAQGFKVGVQTVATFYMQTLPNALRTAYQFVVNFYTQTLPNVLKAGASAVVSAFKAGGGVVAENVKEAAGRMAEVVKEAVGAGVAAAKEAVGNFVANVKEVIGGIWAPIKTALDSFEIPRIRTPAWLEEFTTVVKALVSTPEWLQRFSEIVSDLTGAFDGGGGNGYTPFATKPTATNPFGVAHNGGTIPPGFPNDSFNLRAESGEVVLPTNDVKDLRAFLDREQRGGAGDGAIVEMLGLVLEAIGGLAGRPVEVAIDGAVVARTVQRQSYRNARLTR